MSAPHLRAAARGLLRQAIEVYSDDPEAGRRLRAELDRVDAPLRVAIAGKVKAGKSTLLNALVGEIMAPTDAGECTHVVTWYRHAEQARVTVHPRGGPPWTLPARRDDGALRLDLGEARAEQLDHLVVDWPSRRLRAHTLIDTPGIASTTPEDAERAARFLAPEDTAAPADAVLYLMRHLHGTDLDFLEAFGDREVASATAVNTLAVLSRADEVGAGRLDALQSARKVAVRYRADERLRGLCQDVVAVSGLLAQAGRSLRADEFAAFAELAAAPRDDVEALLLSADRFARPDAASEDMPDHDMRRRLLERYGLFGVRLACTLVRQGAGTPGALADELVRRSGLGALQDALAAQFTARTDLLKARSALLAVDAVLRAKPRDAGRGLVGEVERMLSGAHEFVELKLLNALRTRAVAVPQEHTEEAMRLLVAHGTSAAARLGAPADASPAELRETASAAASRWRRHSENPVSPRPATDAARTVVRSCEGVLAGLTRSDGA
jgi:predicted GTPase